MRQSAFTAKNISLKFTVGGEEVTAVQPGSLSIPEEQITIIFGPSGSGKSSLLNILSGLQAPTSGSLKYGNTDVYGRSQNELAYFRAHELGIVYQTNYWVKSLTVLENVALPQYFLGVTKAEAHRQAQQALERVHMASYANKYPILLSGGEQQRIAFARGIVSNPPVIIADEPTGNLDSKNGDTIMDLFVQLQQVHHKTVILVTHNMEYLPIAHHLIQIQDGKMTEIQQSDIGKTVDQLLGDVQKRIHNLTKRGGAS